ncbi:MAG: aspartate dehydrogenase [Alphaproteobacteria bacterium]|jgi:aspartate dehydrogenase|nr:aspartate dehydrogenase [Alphaproteobacteria bacterium]
MLSVAMIGYGGIAATVARTLAREGLGNVMLTAALMRPGRAEAARAKLGEAVALATTLPELLAHKPELVVEVAGQEPLRAYGQAVLAAGCDLLVSSIGALADDDFLKRLRDAARQGGARLLLPAGAVGGIDALAAMRLGGLAKVRYRSRKPPSAWKGTPAEAAVDLDALGEATVFYRGTARAAALDYPKNANVAATVALAGLGFEATEVELMADPAVTENIHEIEAEGQSGRFAIRLEGKPSVDNPKTSALTALSVARAILNRSGTIEI